MQRRASGPPPGAADRRDGVEFHGKMPPRLFTFAGVEVYICVRWCGRQLREYWYALDPIAAMAEVYGGDLDKQFDVRWLPAIYARADMEACSRYVHRMAITRALMDGFDLFTARPPPPERLVIVLDGDDERL